LKSALQPGAVPEKNRYNRFNVHQFFVLYLLFKMRDDKRQL